MPYPHQYFPSSRSPHFSQSSRASSARSPWRGDRAEFDGTETDSQDHEPPPTYTATSVPTYRKFPAKQEYENILQIQADEFWRHAGKKRDESQESRKFLRRNELKAEAEYSQHMSLFGQAAVAYARTRDQTKLAVAFHNYNLASHPNFEANQPHTDARTDAFILAALSHVQDPDGCTWDDTGDEDDAFMAARNFWDWPRNSKPAKTCPDQSTLS